MGSLKIDLDISERVSTEAIRNAIINVLIQAQHPCVISFRTLNIDKKSNIVQYGKCKYKNHKQKFKFIINCNNILYVYIIGKSVANHGEDMQYYQLRGLRRSATKMDLNHISSQMTCLKQFELINTNLLSCGNSQKIVRQCVMRQARCEKKAEKDAIKGCSVMDVIHKKSNENIQDTYIYSVTDPLQVTLLKRNNLTLLKNKNLIIYIDATGGLVKNPKCCPNHDFTRILYYACIIKIEDFIFPIAELISAKHDTNAISKFLGDFKKEVNSMKPSIAVPTTFIMDWS